MVDGETSPPPLLTEADLIALMDKHGIGKSCHFLMQILMQIKNCNLQKLSW